MWVGGNHNFSTFPFSTLTIFTLGYIIINQLDAWWVTESSLDLDLTKPSPWGPHESFAKTVPSPSTPVPYRPPEQKWKSWWSLCCEEQHGNICHTTVANYQYLVKETQQICRGRFFSSSECFTCGKSCASLQFRFHLVMRLELKWNICTDFEHMSCVWL